MNSKYDVTNVIWRIINKKLPATIVAETNHTLAFADIHPQDTYHILVVPKGQYTNYSEFVNQASAEEIQDYMRLINKIINQHEHTAGKLVVNFGNNQEIPHLHTHIMMH